MNDKQIIFLLHIGFLLILPLVGTTVFNTTKQLIEYQQYGFFYYECSTNYWQFLNYTFTKESFDLCKSDRIIELAISYPISIAMFTFMGNSVRKQIVKVLQPKEVIHK